MRFIPKFQCKMGTTRKMLLSLQLRQEKGWGIPMLTRKAKATPNIVKHVVIALCVSLGGTQLQQER
jgi:hypothetical protein